MKKELPLSDPLANGYHFYGFPLAIAGTVDRARDWILSNYVHLAYDLDPATPVPFCFYLYDYAISPWLDVVRANRRWLADLDADPVEYCRTAVHAGHYVYLNLDDFHVPSRPLYGVRHSSHDLLLCGVDDAARTFSTYGYDKADVLRRSTIGFEEFRAAYRGLDALPEDCTQVYLYRVVPDAAYDFNLRVVRESLEEYLDGTNVSLRFEMLRPAWERAYGVDVYPPLQRYLTEWVEGRADYDIRNLHILWEHKKLMTLRVERMAQLLGGPFTALAEDARALEKHAFRLRNKMFFREAAGRPAEFGHAEIAELDGLRKAEERALREAVRQLRNV
ncbi:MULTISPECIES: hypothetical protein [unclassified Streptomyces]|uniref:hypothetical protein n=1 Tax=unclassified Streptomyces TaxID=2593676 RepID=UPI00332F8061